MNKADVKEQAGERRRWWLAAYGFLGGAVGLALLWHWLKRAGAVVTLDQFYASLPVLLWIVPWFVLPIVAAAISWRCLFPPGRMPGLVRSCQFTWIGLGVNWLLPVAMIGGEVVKVRLAMRHGWHADFLIASLVGDKTLQVATQMLYTLMGLALLVIFSGQVKGVVESMAGVAIFSVAIYAFYRLQRSGIFSGLAAKLAHFSGDERVLRLRAARVDGAIRSMYRRTSRWWAAVAWRLLFRLLMAGEVWLVLYWQGVEVSIWHAITLESLVQGARAAAFFIPAGLGAQETGLVAVGLLLGVPAESLLLLAVVKRLREMIVGGFAILAWQIQEGHWWWHR